MDEFILALIFIFPPTVILSFYLLKFIVTKKTEAVVINEKVAPFLFPLYLVLSASFRLEPLRIFLEWLGISQGIVAAILIFAVLDNIFLFFLSEQRIGKILKAYAEYLKHDTSEFALVVLLALLCSIVTFFKTRAIYESPLLLTAGMFIGVLLFLPLVLYHYHDLQLELKFEVKPELFINLIKMVFFIICPLVFIKLLNLLLISGSISEIVIVFIFWFMELLILFLFWRKIIKFPKTILESVIYQSTRNKTTSIFKRVMLFVYNHIEIAAVVLLVLIVSWPLAIARINHYRDWRSNFPVINKVTPIMGMQGSMLILTGKNFGTTGLGIPGKVLVGQKELMTSEWGDKKIVAIVPVPPPSGDLYVRRKFKWEKGIEHVSESNRMSFKNFDWSSASKEETEKFIELLQTEYRQK